MSLVDKLVKIATGQGEIESSKPEPQKKAAKPSLVQRLAAEHGGEPVLTPEVAPEVTPEVVARKATLVQKAAAEWLRNPAGGNVRLAEIRFDTMEDAQKAVSKIYEQMGKVLEDLKVTGEDLQANNMDLASQKVLDMSHSVQEAHAFFESKFPHLMSFRAPEGADAEAMPPAEPAAEPAAPAMEPAPEAPAGPAAQPGAQEAPGGAAPTPDFSQPPGGAV